MEFEKVKTGISSEMVRKSSLKKDDNGEGLWKPEHMRKGTGFPSRERNILEERGIWKPAAGKARIAPPLSQLQMAALGV